MKISSIHTKELSLLESVMKGTDRETRTYLRNMHENFVVPYNAYLNSINHRLDEAELTPDQITQLFGSVAQGAQASGNNSTMLGKMLPDSIKQKFADSLPPADAGEVPGFDQKAQAAVQQVQDPATKQSLMGLIKQGIQNPVTQKLILTAISGVAGVAASALTGGLGGKLGSTAAGALTGGLMGVITAKLQGADWKTAGMAGLKGAGMGGAAGLVGGMAASMGQQALGALTGGSAAPAQPDATQHRGAASGDMAPGDPDFVLPASSQEANRAVNSANAEAWRNADAAGKKEIEQHLGMTADQLKNIDTGSGAGSSEFAATDPRRVDQQTGAGAGRGSVNPDNVTPSTNTSDTSSFAKQAQDQYALNQRMQAQVDAQAAAAPDTGSGDSAPEAPVTNQGRLKMNQWRQDVGSPNAVPTAADAEPAIEPRGGWGAQEKINQMVQQKVDADYAAQQDTAADTSPTVSNQGRLKMNQWRQDVGSPNAVPSTSDAEPAIEPRGGWGAQEKINQMVQQKVDADYAAQQAAAEPAPSGIRPRLPPGASMSDFSNTSGDSGPTAGGVPVGSTEPGINRLTGKPIAEPTHWDNMTPDQQQRVLDRQAGERADAEAYKSGESYPERLNRLAQQGVRVRGLGRNESVDRNLTIRMWALNESLGKDRGGVHLTEAGIGDVIGKVGSWLKTKGQNLTQTVTADKLQQAWTKAGKPTDSEKIAELLKQQGVDPAIISSTYQSMGIPAATATAGADGKVEPTMEPEAPAQTTPTQVAQTTPTQPTQAAQTAAQPAAQQQNGGGSGIFADPQKLAASFQSYLDAGGTIRPQMRGVLKDILLTALRTVESKQRKVNKMVREAKKIQGQIIALKKQQRL